MQEMMKIIILLQKHIQSDIETFKFDIISCKILMMNGNMMLQEWFKTDKTCQIISCCAYVQFSILDGM